jgi:pimeloyl-ACP methyl ester carboxylesterase
MGNKLNHDLQRMHGTPALHLRPLLLLAFALALAVASSPATFGKDSNGESRYAKLDLGAGQSAARIHYKSYGKGRDALVLIHGWTCSIEYWRDQIPDLAKRNRLIAIDLPGHGMSDKPQVPYTMELFARAVDAVLRDAGVKRAVLAGHSMGTPVARQFYRKYPEKTLAIVIVDGALRNFGDKKIMENMMAGFRSPNYQQTGLGMLTFMEGPALSAADKERIKASFLNTPQHVIVSAMEGMADDSIWGQDKINVPVLAVLAKGPFYPPNNEQIFREIAPNLEYHMWEGVGHFLMMEKPKQFNDTVIGFFDKNSLLKK